MGRRIPKMAYVTCSRMGVLLVAFVLYTTAERVACAEGDSVMALLERGGLAFAERFTPQGMDQAIAAYAVILPELGSLPVQTQALVLDRLAQLYYERTTFTPGDTSEDRESFAAGKGYGLRSLRLNPGFAAWEDEDFGHAVAAVSDAAALLWTANNWGALFHFDPLGGMLHIGTVRALYERCIAVDERYWGASAHHALGAMLVVTPAALGGDVNKGQEHLQRAVALDPSYLENRVVYAQYLGFTYDLFGKVNGVCDAQCIVEELRAVLAAPIGDWPFWNREAKREAQVLLAELAEWTS